MQKRSNLQIHRSVRLMFMVASIIYASLSCASGLTPSSFSLTFEDAFRRLQSHPLLHASRAQIASAEAENKAARALSLPKLGIEGTYGRFSDPIEVNLNPLNQLIQSLDPALPRIPNPILQEDSFGFVMATLAWPVFTGGRIDASKKLTAAGISASSAEADVTENTLLLDLVARYYGVAVNERALSVQESVVINLTDHLNNAKALEREGQIASVERMQVEVALAQAKVEERERRHELEISKAALANLVSLETGDWHISSGPPIVLPAPGDLEVLQQEARRENPIVRQLEAVTTQAKQGIRIARSNFLPDVTVLGAYEIESDLLPELIPEWTLTLNLTMDLFDGGVRSAGVSIAREKLREVESLQRDAINRLHLQIESRYLALEDANSRLAVTLKTESLAKETLRMQRAAFMEGVGRAIDVVDAQNALATTLLQKLAAQYDSVVAWSALMLSSGYSERVVTYLSQPGTSTYAK